MSSDAEHIMLTPSAVVHLFANAIQFEAAREMKRMKGLYVQGKDVAYAGKFYDVLRDEVGEASITLLVPGLIRTQLSNNEVIEVVGFLQRRVQSKGARVELLFEVTEVLARNRPSFQEADIRAFEVLQRKRDAGYLDVDGFIKRQLLEGAKVRIDVLVGKTGIIHSDISAQLKDAAGFYDLRFVPINLSQEREIIQAFETQEADIVAIARGGGDRMEIFDSPELAAAAVELSSYFITALGHTQDTPLLQKVADKAFNTPTALGQHLNDLYQQVMEERSRSMAGLIESVTQQLKPMYEKQIENLQKEFENKELAYQHQARVLQERMDQAATPARSALHWGWVLLIFAIGLAIGGIIIYLLFHTNN